VGKTPEQLYQERTKRVNDAIQLRVPDRVPFLPTFSFFPAKYIGITFEQAMYDYEKLGEAYKKAVIDFELDMYMNPFNQISFGPVMELLDYKQLKWPGHGVSPNQSYQFVDAEYMKADEYDALIDDPSNYFSSTYLPRVFGALEGFKMLPTLTGILEMYGLAVNFIPFSLPPVQETYKKLFEAGAEAMKWFGEMMAWNNEIISAGFPIIATGFSKAPFDVIGDTLRGTRSIMLDMYRQPDKLLETMDRLTPLMIKMGINTAKMAGHPLIFMPLHKGADGFLSDEQFKKFYWPTFRKVMMGLIDEGIVPMPALEGHWTTRLEVIQDLPKGKTLWMVDQSDMVITKKTLGKVACFFGNVPSDLLAVGKPQQVKDYVKKIIDDCAKGGGFIVSNGAFFDNVKAENVHAMVDAAKEYGDVYK